ncbi:hypothetical protein C0993_011078 [Termitomyces sp. T159_Od127]|nr:hypothetical protein C0993_011078 [Termitomyces sp. T159_Od127]
MALGNDGFLADIDVQLIQDEEPEAELHEDKQRDIDQFFHQPVTKEIKEKEKKHWKWAQNNKLDSKLPGDIKKCKANAERVT